MTKARFTNRYQSQCIMNRRIVTVSMALQPSVRMTDRESPNAPCIPSDVLTLIDESTIERVVHEFYHRVRRDSVLGEIFNARIAGRYHGRPLSKHLTLPISAPHFDRWLELFASTVQEICSPAVAELLAQRARLIARSLEGGIASAHGVVLARDERFTPSRDSALQQRGEHP